tara:strand:- start:453 stop:947 length:495 start_codon:yes stop_codon:yes gene_type:complete
MKLKTKIYVLFCILSVDLIYANSDIDDLKRNSNNYISAIKNEFLSVRNKIISPYNKIQFPHESFLDSLYFLSEKLDARRKNMFSNLVGLDLTAKDVKFFDNLNRNSILLYNIINGLGRIYHSYFSYDSTNEEYSFEQYTLEMKNLLALEQEFFQVNINLAKNNH